MANTSYSTATAISYTRVNKRNSLWSTYCLL